MMDSINSNIGTGGIDRSYKQKSTTTTTSSSFTKDDLASGSSSKTSFDSMFKFNYNTRISITLIPAILLVLFLRGRSSIFTSALVIFFTYLVDLLNLPYLTLTALWTGLLIVDVSLITGGLVLVQHSLVNIFLLFNIAMLLALIGVWVSLQFKWITAQYPNLSSACERILFGVIAYPTSVVFTWFSIILNGIDHSPFYLLCFLALSYYIYALPLRSFRLRSSKQITSVNGNFDYPDISIQMFTYLIIVFYAESMLILYYSYNAATNPKSKVAMAQAMIVNSLLLAFIEVTLNTSDPTMYPIYIVYATSIVTIYLTNRLLETRCISFFVKLVCDSAAIAKALSSNLLLPSPDSVVPCFLFTLVIYGLIIYPSTTPLDRKHALYHCIASFIICLFYSSSVCLRLLAMFVNIDNVTSIAMQLSAFLLSFAICIFNLSFKFYPQNRQLRNLIVLLFTSGVLLMILNPSSSFANAGGQQQKFALGNWLLISGLLTALFGMIYRVRISKSTILKVGFSFIFGTLIGLYFSFNYFTLNNSIKRITKTSSNEWVIHILVSLIFNIFSLFMMYAHYPSLRSPRFMNAIYTFFITLFPITYILLGSVYTPYQSIKVLAHLENTRLSTVSLAVGLNLLIVMYLKYHVSTAKHHHSKANTAYMNSPLKKQTVGSTSMKSSSDWVFSISSFACVLSYLTAVAINMVYLGGSELCVFVLSPLLLLLNTERGLLKKLSESHRYAPMLFSISTLLTIFSLIDTLAVASNTESSYEWYRFFGLSSGFWRVWWNFKNWALLMTTLPSVYYINRYLWKFERQSQFKWLIFAPPAILAMLFSDIMSINLLGLIGFVGAILQRFISSQLQRQSNQVI
ncbi:hypothetical protein PPL_04475 [Heterostelium album PN500]|uniref:Uncharacterized protein n=1 Tax=Heterostelium pallidum (strain ATCC 26659 / Pp 5 / PN500) TaxID=670386 RepID=D3B7N7_HETP5|nr:hypothetical protein PPL_04475 [Heterostelium album PN500]EFA82780.1 hypothetical protein PPL_04475 [Heterostelium album PN500]|eukprot:XP_020434897.1 hypothetical protein PPL_04475 [Heterostelium album PN500]